MVVGGKVDLGIQEGYGCTSKREMGGMLVVMELLCNLTLEVDGGSYICHKMDKTKHTHTRRSTSKAGRINLWVVRVSILWSVYCTIFLEDVSYHLGETG